MCGGNLKRDPAMCCCDCTSLLEKIPTGIYLFVGGAHFLLFKAGNATWPTHPLLSPPKLMDNYLRLN